MKELKLLLWKNFKVLSREKMSTLAEIFAPLVFIIVFGIFRTIIKSQAHAEPAVYDSFGVVDIPDTVREQASILLYTPSNPTTDAIMDAMWKNFFQGEGFNYTVKAFAKEDQMAEAYAKSRDEGMDVFSRGPVLAGIVFHKFGPKKIPSHIKYTLRFPSYQRTKYSEFTDRTNFKAAWFTEIVYPILRFSGPRANDNHYGGFPGYFEEGFLYLQQALDKSITRILLHESQVEDYNNYTVRMQRFPHPPFAHDKYLVISLVWIPYLVGLAYIYSIMNLTRLIIHEKVTRIKEFMKIMGLANWQHWASWFIRSFTIAVIIAILSTLLFKVEFGENLSVYPNTNPFLLFWCLFLYGMTAITYSFLCSALFSNVDAGATIAGFTWIVFIFPFFGYFPKFCEMTREEKIWRSILFPNTSMCFAFYILGLLESDNVGLRWETLWTGASPNDCFSIGDCMVIMAVNSLVYLVAAFYLELAFPGPYGVKLPWYYPFTVWFWTGRSREPKIKPLKSGQILPGAFEPAANDWVAGVEFRQLSKVFGSKVAVNNLNFKMYENQVTALLGHNGAGKTTTMSILTGLIRPSNGTALVNHFDICTDMPNVRASLGLCPQYNILFDNLTVEEHLKFYCQLKGLSQSETLQEIERCLKVLGLEEKRYSQSKNLSGGMKRKLCVGIAFSAGSQVVLLDEPTAGMDPSARRSTWDLIQHEKLGKTVILSTHYMEEADLLGDRIAIMNEGQLQCCGSSLFLKAKYGGTYKLMIVKKENSDVEGTKNVIGKLIPAVEFKDIGAEISCALPPEHINLFPKIFDELEDRKDELGIGTYGVGSTTMEEIFVRVGESAKEHQGLYTRYDDPSITQGTHTPIDNSPSEIRVNGFNSSLSTLYRPHTHRNEGCKLLWQQLRAMLVKKFLVNLRKWNVATLQVLIPAALNIVVLNESKNVPAFEDPKSLAITFKGFESLKNSTVLFNCLSESLLCQSLKTFQSESRNVEETADASMVTFLLEEMDKSILDVNSKYVIGFEQSEKDDRVLTAFFNNQAYHTPALVLNQFSNGFMHYFGLTNRITIINHPFKLHFRDKAFSEECWGPEFFVGFSALVAASFLSAAFVILPVLENLSRSKHLQQISGIRLPVYWLAELIVSYGVYTIATLALLLTTIFMAGHQFESFSMQVRYMVLLFAHGVSLLPFIMFVSKFCKSPTAGYSRLLAVNLTSGALCCVTVSLLNTPEFKMQDAARIAHKVSLIHPGYSLGTGLAQLGAHYQVWKACEHLDLDLVCEADPHIKCCTHMQSSYFAWEPFGCGKQIVLMCSFGLVFLVLLIVSESGIMAKIQLVLGKCWSSEKTKAKTNGSMELGDADVVQENVRITRTPLSSLRENNILILKGLTKIYKGKLRAVDDLNLGVKNGEIFGLLGINGAGKTSTLGMLTGDTTITAGDAYINSFSVKKHPRKAHSFLGYCPQFDACIEELTGRETLTMFGRIRGIPETEIKSLITKVSNNLLFNEFLDKSFAAYSGGNKRKLSTALAMLGDPTVILLDEPTAGMDPVARRHVWDAISLLRDTGTSVVITSHNMEECEALCSRLAIMVRGKFQCLGSLQSLKSKLSPGYKLVAQIPYGAHNPAIRKDVGDSSTDWIFRLNEFNSFLKKAFPGCALKDSHPGFVQYTLSTSIGWSQIFSVMEAAKIKFQLEAYSVGQVDLEQVFFNFAQQ